MVDYRGNIDHWIKQSEPDYYLFFLKTWIPFNAWYVAELPSLDKKDTKIIKELQENEASKPRSIIIDLLKSETFEAIKFKSHIAELNYFLENHTIIHNKKRLAFSQLDFCENHKTFERTTDKKGNVYKCEKQVGFYEAIIRDKTNKTILHFKYSSYNLEELKKHDQFIRISEKKIQNIILDSYEKINPNNSISIISNSKIKNEFIQLKSEHPVNVIKNEVLIAKSILHVLYAVRCMLFHGEIEPNRNNLPLYEHSYFILKQILKKLN